MTPDEEARPLASSCIEGNADRPEDALALQTTTRDDHECLWTEAHEGYRCACGEFVPFGSEPWAEQDDDDDDDWDPGDTDPDARDCLICCGEGGQFGCDLGDPLRYDDDEWVTCSSCGGSGARKDMTWW